MVSVWFWNHISPCRPPYGVCGKEIQNAIRTLDLLDEAQLLTQSSLVTILCGTAASELGCLETFFQRCLSRNDLQHRFYTALHMEVSSAVQHYCGNQTSTDLSKLPTCWRGIRYQRGECITEFLQSPGGKPRIVMDSLFDDSDTGVYRKEFCWSIREAFLCNIGVLRLVCGENEAKTFYHLSTNITEMIFTEKCDESLHPHWKDSTYKLAMGSSRFIYFLRILSLSLIFALLCLVWKLTARVKRIFSK